jgi:PAS domain S-box-containing protein
MYYMKQPIVSKNNNNTAATPSSDLLVKITDLVPGLIAVYNIRTGKYIYVNDSVKKILGYKKEEWLTKGLPFVVSLVHPDDLKTIMQKNAMALKKANSKNYKNRGHDPIVAFEYRVKHKNGSWRWLKSDGVVFQRDNKGKVAYVMNISIDITERKKAEDDIAASQVETQNALSSSRDQLEVILKNIADGVTVQDVSGKLVYANQRAAQLSGYKSVKGLLSAPPGDFLKRFEMLREDGSPIQLKDLPGRRAIAGEENPSMIIVYINKVTKAIKWSNVRASLITRKGEQPLIVNTIQDITDLKKIEQEQSRLAAIVESSDDAIISKALDGTIISWNTGAYRLFGYTNKEIIGKNITHLIPKYLWPEEIEIVEKIRNGERLHHFETIRIKKDGSKVPVSLSLSPIKNNNGTITGISTIARDITKQKEFEKQRDDFISIATHELKTPVTSVKAYAQVLENIFLKKKDQKSAHYLAKMDSQLNKLTNLIGDLLDVNKIQSGQLHFNPQTFDLNLLINEIIEELQRTTQKHKIIKKLIGSKKVHADRERIGQVLTNLISNAIKYSPLADKIIVSTKIENEALIVGVKDFGIGIPKNKQDKIFDKFFRISGPRNETFPGMGLGLHISSEFVKRQGGKIWLKSVEGKGSVFYFSLPLGKKVKPGNS